MTRRVLEVFREPLANGGQESFIMNMYRNMDRSLIQMDFLTPFGCDNPDLQKEIESMGGRVYAYGHEFGKDDNKVFHECLEDFLRSHLYEVVHFHSGSTYALMEGPRLAFEAGIPNRIVHSHCTGFPNAKYRIIKALSVPYFLRFPTHFCACSHLAAAWKFPKSIIRKQQYRILKNAIDLEAFSYSLPLRKEIRAREGVENQEVLGHVGRFSQQKNHDFLIDIFNAYHALHPQSVLWLIGTGELEDAVREKVKALKLEECVKFFGLRKDIPDLMNAMDVLVLPSFFEGLPVVGVEAQGCALPVVCSDLVTKELPVSSLSWYLPLGQECLGQWCTTLEKAMGQARVSRKREMTEAGYEVHQAARELQDFYLSLPGDLE